ncbi:MAG: hypothetical protein GY952_17635 [Rhodobacteraceae bacterium]|nr:hypothetical protein [Paracoccaceae bacterium]
MIYNIYLVNRARDSRLTRWSEGKRNLVVQSLNTYYAQILASPDLPAGCPFQTASASFSPGSMRQDEVAVFFVNQRAESIIANHGGAATMESGGACFKSPRGMMAEVYVDQTSSMTGLMVAALVMHELLHYKLEADPSDQAIANVHDIAGAGLHQGTFSSTVLTQQARDLMAQRLMHQNIPYTNPEYGLSPPH